MTDLLNSTTLKTEGFGGFIRPTAAERAAGRFMRAPEHDAGTADAGAADAGAADAGASGDADAGSGSAADDAGADGAADDATVLGSATTEDGAGDDKGEDDTGEKADAKPDAAVVPETYDLKPFTVGEGDDAKTVEIDTGLLEEITPGLKEAGVSQEQLDKLAPTVVPAIQAQVFKQQNDAFAQVRADWAKEAKEDAEIGGKNFPETTRLAAKALDHFGAKSEVVDGKETNEFRKLLNESGLGNHPVMLKMFRNIGAAVAEDGTFVRNTNEVREKKSREEANYPEDVPKK